MTGVAGVCAALTTALLAAGCARGADVARAASHPPPDVTTQTIARFDAGVYGASGVVKLPDGRILIAEDEERHPFDLVDVFGTGAAHSISARELARVVAPAGVKGFGDLEALTLDSRGHVYASTSHSLTAKGESRPERELLLRFDVRGNAITNLRWFTGLKTALVQLNGMFAAAADSLPDAKKGLNIEGLAWDPAQRRLLIGFRNPRRKHDALVVWLSNPDRVFDEGAVPVLEGPIRLDLNGDGVRDLTYSAALSGFLVVAGAWRHDQHTAPTLWWWNGAADSVPLQLRTAALDGLKPEGIAEIQSGAHHALLIVSDDGKIDELYDRGRSIENDGVASRYAIVPLAQLESDNPQLPHRDSRPQ